MKNLFNNIYLSVLFLCFSAAGYAQLYPVQLTPVFNSPYSVKISDYATSMDTKMQLLINPTDISISQRQVRLKLYIQGNGLNIQSSDYIQGQRPIFINGGELQTLTNTDIAALFRLENLQGISSAQYANGLSEGMYSFCFEMYDFVTNQKISQKSCASLYLILNDPPILNTPQRNEQIASTEFPNILFTWTPRQRNATNVSYKFELKQLIDPTLDPQIAFQMSPVLYEETLFGTALLYNLSMPILTPGMRYAWRVKAISTTGLSENAVFKNDGYSEIYSFKYTSSCAAPTFLLSESQSSKSVKITWEGTPEHTRYQVQYKKQDVRNAQWFSANSLNTQSLINNLEPGITYQFRVGSSCDPATEGVQSFTYSGISTFTTPTETSGVAAYNCGIIPQINIQNQKPLTNLIQSETFKAGDFPVTILELQGENSPYSGRGYIIVPYLADTKIAVEFKDIVINTDYQLISGVVETSYNPDWKNVTDVEDFTGEGQGGQVEETVPFIIKDIVINANGDIVVNGTEGEQVTIPGGKDTVITDSGSKTADGKTVIPPKVYNVDSKGNGSNEGVTVAEGGKPTPENTDGVDKSGQATAFTAKGISIAFSGNNSKYAFDVMPNNASAALQKLYKKAGDVVLPYKAVLNGDTDTLLATVTTTDANVKLDSIVFKTQNGAKIDFTRNDKVFVLTIKGSLSYAEEQIVATIKQGNKWKVIGAFMLVHISPKEVNVVLVPTDTASQNKLDEIITKTQAIYNKIGVKVNFKKENILNIDSVVSGNTIQTEKNTLTSTYSTDQQKINALYQSTESSYVLFITNKSSSTGQQGYMRLNGQFGYVFNSGLNKTPAHELGHGIFKLEHPFELYKTKESSTDLLMDYGEGTVLNHQDWKQINDPVFKLYAFQSQSSGEFAGGYVVSPDYKIFTIGTDHTKFDKNTYSDNDITANDGTLPGFVLSGKKYWWKDDKYVNDENNFTLTDVSNNLNLIKDKWLYLFFDKDKECGKTAYVTVKISDYIASKKSLKDFISEYTSAKTKQLVVCNNANAKDWTEVKGGSGGNTQGLFVKNLIKGEVKKEVLDKLVDLMSGKSKNWITGQAHKIKGHILLTAEAEQTNRVVYKDNSFYVDNVKEEVKPDEIVFWLEYSKEGKIRVKQIISGSSFDENISVALKSWESSLDWKQKTLFEKLIAIGYQSVDGYFTAYYDMFDMLSSSISKVMIKPSVYDCTASDYNKIYAEVFSYFNFTSLLQDAIIVKVRESYPEFNDILGNPDVKLSQIQFALFCGVYNGLIDVIKSVPDLAKLLISPLSSKGRDEVSKFIQQLSEKEIFDEDEVTLACESCGVGISFPKIWYFIKEGFVAKLDSSIPCSTAEFVGSIAGPIVVMCLGDEVAGTGIISRVASTTIKIFQYCDKIADPFRYVGMSFKFVKKASGKVFLIIKNASGDVVRQIENDLFRIRVIINNTEVTRNFSAAELGLLVEGAGNGANLSIDGLTQNVRMTGVSVGEATLATMSKEIFGEINETLLKRFKDLGLSEAELKRVVDKLGNSVVNGKKLAELLEKAPFKDDVDKIRSFLTDIKASTDLQDLTKAGQDFAKEWDLLKRAGRDIKLRGNKAAIESLSNILNDASMKKILGSEMDDVMEKFITAHKSSKWGWNKFSFQEHMRMLKVIANKYEGVEGFNKSLRDALNNPNPAVQDGFWHMMKDLEKRGIPKEKVKAFDLEFDGDDLPCIKCKFDVELNGNGDGIKYLEYKSYANASRISKPQFLNYISTVDNLEQLKYVFNKSKLSLDDAKAGMKEFLLNNSDNMFKSISEGGIGKDKIKQLFEFSNFKFDNVTEFKNLLNNNESFRNNALKFVTTN